MLASQAKRLSDSYWDKVNLHSIVYHDMTKLYDLIKSVADDGKNSIVFGSSELPQYFYYKFIHDISKERRSIMEKRRMILIEKFISDGYLVDVAISDSRWDFSEKLIVKW